MADQWSPIHLYIVQSAETFLHLCFFLKVLRRKASLPSCFLFVVCANIVLYFLPFSTSIRLGAFSLLLAGWGALSCHADLRSSLLYAALAVEITQLCRGVTKPLFYILLMPFASCRTIDTIFLLSSETASLLLTGACYWLVYRHFSCYTAAEAQCLFLVFIPLLMIFITGEYIDHISFDWKYIEKSGAETFLINHAQTIFMQLLGIVSLFCILFAHKKLLQSFHLRTELSLLAQKEHSLNQYVEEARSHYNKTRAFRHDIRNHFTVVKDLLQEGKTEQAIRYIGDMEELADESPFPCSTNNPVVDILAGNKLGIADSMGIDVSCCLSLPNPCGLRDIDICIILSNALDNAIHACRDMDAAMEKYIHVSGRTLGDLLMIEVENSCSGTDGFQKSIGLSNIEIVAEKYGGAMLAEKVNGRFSLSVLLNIS